MPSIAITQPYEAVYIVSPDLGDEQIQTITTKYRQVVENGGGTVDKVDVWERRKLAYEIKGRTEGIYIVMQFHSKPAVEAELRRIFQISEDQIRFLIVRQEDADTAAPVAANETAPASARPTIAPAAEAAPAPAPVAEEAADASAAATAAPLLEEAAEPLAVAA